MKKGKISKKNKTVNVDSKINHFIKSARIEMTCPRCKDGRMEPVGISLVTGKPMIVHGCCSCGFVREYKETYPHIKWLDEHEYATVNKG